MTKEEIILFLKTNKDKLQKKFNVNKIGLFGSYAKGQATKDSDIDIIVDMPPSFDGYYNLKEYLESAFGKKVDLGLEKNIREFIKDKIENEIIYV